MATFIKKTYNNAAWCWRYLTRPQLQLTASFFGVNAFSLFETFDLSTRKLDNKFILNHEDFKETNNISTDEMMAFKSVPPSSSDGNEDGNNATKVIQTFEPSENENGDALLTTDQSVASSVNS